jgi:hypothetical protein
MGMINGIVRETEREMGNIGGCGSALSAGDSQRDRKGDGQYRGCGSAISAGDSQRDRKGDGQYRGCGSALSAGEYTVIRFL